jgi:rubrerythrin
MGITEQVEPLRTCEFCGYEFPDYLGRYGCPNCEANGE